jgi:quercetin dioxygenase-like cupin family protein
MEDLRVRGIAFLFVAVVTLAGVAAFMAPLSGQVDGEAAAKEGQPQAGAVAEPRDDLARKLARREVQRSPSSISGREIVQVETLIAPGVESGWHAHPGAEAGYIIAGQVEMMVHGRAAVVLHPGDGFLIPPRTPHNARDLGPDTGRMLSTYVVETGPPIAAFVDQSVQR